MILIRPESVSDMDAYATQHRKTTEEALIRAAGEGVAKVILAHYTGGEVLVLCGGGNNGADGYATALSLAAAGVPVKAVDVLNKGQRSEGGRAVLAEYREKCGVPLSADALFGTTRAAVIVDAVFGSGARGALSEQARQVCEWMGRQAAFKVAVDIPLGVDADYGCVQPVALRADLTVMLSLPKRGLFSYPAKEYCGELVMLPLGFDTEEMYARYGCAVAMDEAELLARLPRRTQNSHKGSYGKLYAFCGSHLYRGAPHLCALGALRMGVGMVRLITEEAVIHTVGGKLPELLFDPMSSISAWSEAKMAKKAEEATDADAILVGPGSGVSEGLYRFVRLLCAKEGAPLLLDADALGAIARYAPDVDAFFAEAARPLLLTPHPLEFARLIHATAAEVQRDRMRLAVEYAKRWGVSLLLKGAGTVITDGEHLILNTTGSSALSKGGSGDVLAGAVGALLCQGASPIDALAVGAHLHGAAGDSLAAELSEYGVIPSDLPARMASLLAKLLKASAI